MIGPDFAKLTPGELDKILPKLQGSLPLYTSGAFYLRSIHLTLL